MLASDLRDALLGGACGLVSVIGMVIFIFALIAIDRRKLRGRPHPSNPEWDPDAR